MTFGEMLRWTQRFNQIIGGAQCLKQKRLEQLKSDLDLAYANQNIDHYALRVYAAVVEELEVA